MTIGTGALALVLILQAGNEKKLQVDMSEAVKTQQAQVDKPLMIERKAGKMIWRWKAQQAEPELKGSMHLIDPE
ncbi:MAG: hypothetical protein Q9M23_08940, partial [Mariprofundaceae bacterium]|nr:hypothetical protein [Mariprofundaceae bacterium]